MNFHNEFEEHLRNSRMSLEEEHLYVKRKKLERDRNNPPNIPIKIENEEKAEAIAVKNNVKYETNEVSGSCVFLDDSTGELVTVDEDTCKEKFSTNVFIKTSSFKILVKYSECFVDKTGLIKMFLTYKYVLVTVPKGFGKSVNLNMLKLFFEHNVDENGVLRGKSENYKLFTESNHKLEICNDTEIIKTHLGQHPVIFADFSSCESINDNNYLKVYQRIIHKIFLKHKYLATSEHLDGLEKVVVSKYCDEKEYLKLSKRYINGSLDLLAEYLFKHFKKKVIVLIDDYDLPFRRSFGILNICLRDVIHMQLQIIGSLVTDENDHIEGVFVTGLSLITHKRANFRNLNVFRFLRDVEFSRYFGFSEKDVKDIFNKNSVDEEKCKEAIEWYCGYRLPQSDSHICCPPTILNYLETTVMDSNCEMKNYLTPDHFLNDFTRFLSFPKVRLMFIQLSTETPLNFLFLKRYQYQHIEYLRSFLIENQDNEFAKKSYIFVNYLMENGYLTTTDSKTQRPLARGTLDVEVPNKQIRKVIDDSLYRYFTEINGLDKTIMVKISEAINTLSSKSKEDIFVTFLHLLESLLETCNTPGIVDQHFVHSLICFLATKTSYKCRSVTTLHTVEIIVLTRDCEGIVMLIQYNGLVDRVFDLMVGNNYGKLIFEGNAGCKTLVALNICSNLKLEIKYQIESQPVVSYVQRLHRKHLQFDDKKS